MSQPLDILICGSSIAGPTLATCLLISSLPSPLKPRITLLERSSALRTAGQNIDVRGAGIPIIRHLGLEPAIRASTTGEEGVQHVDARNRVWTAIAADRTGKVKSPTADMEIMRGRLAEICVERCRSVSEEVKKEGGQGVEFLFGDYVEEIVQQGDRVEVRLAKSGEKRSFDLVVGADGLHSKTRNLAFGEDTDERVKKLGMYSGFFSMPPGDTDTMWRRWYHTSGGRGVMFRPDVTRNKTTVIMSVVNEEDERLPGAVFKGAAAQKELLREYFQDAGWESERAIRGMMETDDFYYDMLAQVKMDHWSKGRVVLLGDAGYCASPLSGQGTTLALTGAYNLAGAILAHPTSPATAFALYERAMRPIVADAQKLMPGMPHLLHPQTAWGVWTLLAVFWVFHVTRFFKILVMVFAWFGLGPFAEDDEVELVDYGFRRLSELKM